MTLVNLGSSDSDKQYHAVIKGLAIDGAAKIWIVEMIDTLESAVYPYSHCTMPEGCIRSGWL